MTEFQGTQIFNLRTQGFGYRAIASALGLSRDNVRNYCKTRNMGGYGVAASKNVEMMKEYGEICYHCGSKISQPLTGRPKKFCSDKCRREWWKIHPQAYTKHGLNVHAVIIDELHAQPNRELFDVMTKGSGDARTQPLFFIITTAGTDRHSICFEQHQKAEDILLGRKIDPTFYPVIYGIADDDDWGSEENWYKANPSLGFTIDIEKVRNAYISAKENPAEENLFRQLRLNQWVKQSTRWMPMDKWDKCAFAVNTEELRGSAYVPTMVAGAKVIAFGDFKYYWIADRQARSFKRLNELFATTGQVGFLGSQRVDGKLILPEAIKTLAVKGTA